MRYIRLIKNKISQRVLVGAESVCPADVVGPVAVVVFAFNTLV
jgi:hypothetical protein